MSCPVAPISAYLLRAFHVSLVTRHSGLGGGDRYQDPCQAGTGVWHTRLIQRDTKVMAHSLQAWMPKLKATDG